MSEQERIEELLAIKDDETLQIINDYYAEQHEVLASAGEWPQELRDRLCKMLRGRLWLYCDYAIGFVPPDDEIEDISSQIQPIQPANTLTPDPELKDKNLTIRLGRIGVQDYPGFGTRKLLLFFSATHTGDGKDTTVQHMLALEAEGKVANAVGYPIFVNLRASNVGCNFIFEIVQIEVESDRVIYETINSQAFQRGLQLISQSQPVLAPFVGLVEGLRKRIDISDTKKKNYPVMRQMVGLSFQSNPNIARIRKGTYFVVQYPRSVDWNWSDCVYDRQTSTLRYANDKSEIPYNSVSFSVESLD